MNAFLFKLLDLLLFEFVDLGLGPLECLLGLGGFFERPLNLIKCHGDPLMDLRRLDRQLLGDWGDRFFVFEVPSYDGGFLLSGEFSTYLGLRNPPGIRLS